MNLDIIPNGAIKRVHVSQNDVGRTLTFELFNNSTSYTVPSGAVVKIQGTKPSGFGFSETCTVSGNTVTVDTTETMTDEYGYIDTELQIKYNGNTIGTSNFVLAVEKNPHPDTITDGSMDTIIPELTLLVNEVKGYAEEIEGTYHAYGSPWVASTVAEMTDTDKIYVYTGSESGYTNGNWYYYNGSAWVSGGVYNAVAVQTDTTLTQSGVPADAKVVGQFRDDDVVVLSKTVNWQAGYVRANGSTVSSTLSQMALVKLSKGETVTIGTRNNNTGIICSTSSESISVGDSFTPISTTSATDQFETRSYTASADINIVLCVRTSEYTLSFTKKSMYALKDDVGDIANGINKKDISPTGYIGAYGYVSSSNIAKGQPFNGDGIILDLTNINGKLIWGYDSSLTYPTQVIMGMTGTTLPSPYCMYYLKSDIESGTASSFETRGFDLSHKSDGYITIDIAKLKTALPTIKALVINFVSGSYLLQLETNAKTPLVITVDSKGYGDYTTISDAVANANNGDTIYIKDGEYKETVVVNKYLHLVGQSKQGTILYQNIGDYNNCPLLITQGSVCNMTIKSIAPSDTSGLTDYAYAIHLDKNFASLAKYQKCEIYNCGIYSEVNDAIGAGTNYASEYDIHDCLLHVAHNPVKTGSCGFKCHNGQNQTTGKVTLKNNVIITEDANGTSCYDILFHNGGISNTQPIEILMVGNVLKYYHNGITNIFVPSDYNYGNSVTEMNTL